MRWQSASMNGLATNTRAERERYRGGHKHGVCSDTNWPYAPEPAREMRARSLPISAPRTLDRARSAPTRVNRKDIVAMHSAITEVGILFATARAYRGWEVPGKDGMIEQSAEVLGAHAFAIMAYDEKGSWVKDSVGTQWGTGGFGQVSYDDWLDNGLDVWVGRALGSGAPENRRGRGDCSLCRCG